jgi:hypothetical protein
MRYLAIEPTPDQIAVRIDQNEGVELLVDKGVNRLNAENLMDRLPCGVRLSVGGMSIVRIS